MRFAYRRYLVQGTVPNSTTLLLRPEIDVLVTGPAGDYEIQARVDTGADDTMFPDRLIATFGVAELTGYIPITGFGGISFARYGTVDLEISQGTDSERWSTRVGFHPHHVVVLGLKGFLQFFKATFHGGRHYLDLTSTGIAPPPVYSS